MVPGQDGFVTFIFFINAEGVCWLSGFRTMPPTLMYLYICEHWLFSEDLLG